MPAQLTFTFDDNADGEVPDNAPAVTRSEMSRASDEPAPTPARGTVGAGHEARASQLSGIAAPTGADRPATIIGCLAWLEHQLGRDDRELKDIRGGVTTIATVVHRTKDRVAAAAKDLPSDPAALRPMLRDALPASLGVSQSRWHNAKSLLKSLLIATGWVSRHARPGEELAAPWRLLLSGAPVGKLNSALRPFLRFCDRLGVQPHEVSADHLSSYEDWLARETLDLRPRSTVIDVQTAWRRLQRIYPAWPRQELRTPSRVWKKALDFKAFPASFEADVVAYMDALRDPDPLDQDLNLGHPMSETTVQHTRRFLLRGATYLVEAGVPASKITGIARLVEPDAYHAILMALHTEGKPMLAASGETAKWTLVADAIASTLLLAARRWVKVGREILEQLTSKRKMVKPRRVGLSNRVQDRLADLATDEDRQALHDLPSNAFDVADRLLRERNYRRAAKLHETAIALAIILVQPLRLANLANLDLVRHVIRDARGRLTQISIPATEVKNKVNVRFEVPPDLAARIERHVAKFRVHIPGNDTTTALLPGVRGNPRQPQSIGRHIRRLVEQQLGKRFHVHLARHLAVDVILEGTGGNLRLAQKVLGHRKERTTGEVYGSRVTLAANRTLQGLYRDQAQRVTAKAVRKAKTPNTGSTQRRTK